MDNKILLTPDNIQSVLGESSADKLILMNFYSAQQPECIEQASILEKLASTYTSSILIATVDCDVQQALASQLAQQVGLQTLPTIVVLKGGAPIDVIAGAKTEQEIVTTLSDHLPAPEQILLDQAKQALAKEDLSSAFSFAKQAYEVAQNNTRVKLVFADICIQIQKTEEATALLDSVEESERDAYYTNLRSKLTQLQEAQESPELKRLVEAVEASPLDFELRTQLAQVQLDAGKKEAALDSLLVILKQDLNYGEVKKSFLDIIASLPEGDSVATTYRRKLYSLLY